MKCARYRRTIGVSPRWATMSNRVVAIVKKRKKSFIPFDVFFNKTTLLFAASIDWLLFVE